MRNIGNTAKHSKTNKRNNLKQSKKNNEKKVLFAIIFIIVTTIYIIYISNSDNSIFLGKIKEINNNDGLALEDTHNFDNVDYLTSNNLSIKVENNITKINGIVSNSSNDIISELKCIYSLFDSSNNLVYELKIPIAKILPNDSNGFASVTPIDLSNVIKYSVHLED